MKKQFTIIALLLLTSSVFAQETHFKEYSFAEFFKMIEKEQDSIFELKNTIIRFNAKTDSSYIVKAPYMEVAEPLVKSSKVIIDKEIKLENVHFSTTYNTTLETTKTGSISYSNGVLHNIHFKKKVSLIACLGLDLYNSEFDERFTINNNNICVQDEEFYWTKKIMVGIAIGNNSFHKGFNIVKFCEKNKIRQSIQIFHNTFNFLNDNQEVNSSNGLSFNTTNGGNITFFKNKFFGNSYAYIMQKDTERIIISENEFNETRPTFNFQGSHTSLVFNKNKFTTAVQLSLNNLSPSDVVEWKQFKSAFYSGMAFENHINLLPDETYFKTETDSFRSLYWTEIRIQNAEVYAGESALKGTLYRHYRENFDMVHANEVFINLKDFETARMEYLYDSNPSFDTYFTWKVNQFLKVFSNYGTKPSKAIVFSVYVVFIFALVYLFFPNSWDKHGKNRIVNRYNFFFKYMKRKAGIHEVYLEDQKEEIMSYDQFKDNILSSEQKVPKFFTATALPLYKWAISGTNLSASILKRVDIMKGTWQELPQHKRIWKSILLVGAFTIAVLYDIVIKMLNALMLSINTFTTLGFGEIPIKGLPRYLAIIQGFIGWFMLTIFSVSLISQLLN